MKKSMIIAAACIVLSAPAVHAQSPRLPAGDPPRLWIHASGVMYTTISSFVDPGSDSRWVFDEPAFGGGIGVQREFGTGLMLGLDATYTSVKYQRTDLNASTIIASGNAGLGSAMVTGRFAYGGGSDIGIYLSGGAGTLAYKLEDLGSWNADFAMRAGTGIEYRFAPNKAVALEWLRMWAYHEKEELGGDTQRPSMLRLNVRLGL